MDSPMDYIAFALMDVVGWIDRKVWRQQQRDMRLWFYWAIHKQMGPFPTISIYDEPHDGAVLESTAYAACDGWRPGRYV